MPGTGLEPRQLSLVPWAVFEQATFSHAMGRNFLIEPKLNLSNFLSNFEHNSDLSNLLICPELYSCLDNFPCRKI